MRRGRAGGAAFHVLCFVAAFALVALAVRRFAPYGSGLERMDVKLERYEERADEFELVFLGSSRAMRGFEPARFDEKLAERGVELRSFNFGVAGARITEMLFLLARIADARPKNLRFVLIDPEDLDQIHDTRNALAQAGILWHDPSTTRIVVEQLVDEAAPRERRDEILVDHLRSCALNVLNVGRTARWVNAALGRRASLHFVDEVMGERGDGYTALFDDQQTLRVRRRRFERNKAEFERMVEQYRGAPRPRIDADPHELELLRLVEQRVRALGAEPVWVIQPSLTRQWELVDAHERGEIGALLRYDEPEAHPELFAHENRFDSLHLNDAGARLFTERLADDFATWLAKGGSDAR